jgi:SAM-dependent methyltransferase
MPTWTNIISESFKILNNRYDLKQMTFVDVGSGKGKVLIHWSKLLRRQKISMELIGIEYSTQLVAISKINLKETNLENNIKIFNSDILEFDFKNYGYCFIFFMYNPFSDVMLKRFLSKIKYFKCIIIYVNGQQNNLKDLQKLKLIYSNNKKLPHESLLIYENTPYS